MKEENISNGQRCDNFRCSATESEEKPRSESTRKRRCERTPDATSSHQCVSGDINRSSPIFDSYWHPDDVPETNHERATSLEERGLRDFASDIVKELKRDELESHRRTNNNGMSKKYSGANEHKNKVLASR